MACIDGLILGPFVCRGVEGGWLGGVCRAAGVHTQQTAFGNKEGWMGEVWLWLLCMCPAWE